MIASIFGVPPVQCTQVLVTEARLLDDVVLAAGE